MKRIFLFSLLALFITLGKSFDTWAAQSDAIAVQFTKPAIQHSMPKNAVFYDEKGTAVDLNTFKGNVILLNFWKATCRKCLVELPSLNRLQERFPKLVIIAVSEGDEPAEQIENVLHKERRLGSIKVATDKGQALLKAFDGEKVPQTRLIDQNGDVVGFIKGAADFDADAITEQISSLLNK